MEQVFSLDTHYELKNDNSKITLDVLIGDEGQSPDYTVRLNTKKLLEHSNTSIKNFDLGTDSNVDGKALRINGNIADTSKNSNKIELTLRVRGGVEDLKKKFTVTVEEEGEVVLFSLVIRFFA
jgi:hypothetical protein